MRIVTFDLPIYFSKTGSYAAILRIGMFEKKNWKFKIVNLMFNWHRTTEHVNCSWFWLESYDSFSILFSSLKIPNELSSKDKHNELSKQESENRKFGSCLFFHQIQRGLVIKFSVLSMTQIQVGYFISLDCSSELIRLIHFHLVLHDLTEITPIKATKPNFLASSMLAPKFDVHFGIQLQNSCRRFSCFE